MFRATRRRAMSQGLRPRTKEFYRQEEALQALEERGGFPSEIAQCAKLACERKQGGCRLQGMNAVAERLTLGK